jgi:protein TonB
MPNVMFEEVVCPRAAANRKWYTLPLSFALHTGLVGILIIVPLVVADALPAPRKMLNYMMADVPPAVPTAPSVAPRRDPQLAERAANPDAAPLDAPLGITRESGLEMMQEPAVKGIENVVDGFGTQAGIFDSVPVAAREADIQPVRVSSGIKTPTRIKDVPPIYPEIARQARVQGVVILEAIIGADGRVQQARVLRSVPLLDQAAINAVQSWEYTPTLLSGRPVPIIMTVTVQFRLE